MAYANIDDNTYLKPLWNGFHYHHHQVVGVQWMLNKERVGTLCPRRNGGAPTLVFGGFQCDDMGLGKTIQMAATMKNNPKRRTLLFAPLAMIETWSGVMKRCGFNVFVIDAKEWCVVDEGEDEERVIHPKKPSVYITNYEKILHSPSLFIGAGGVVWDRVVLDESHKIRTGDGAISVAMRKVVAPIRWAMTGTPLVNKRTDVVAQLAFLGVPVSSSWTWETHFEEIIQQILIHRSLDSLRAVLPDAPPLPYIEEKILTFDSEAEAAFYRLIQGSIHAALARRYERDVLTAQEKLVMLVRLRQISVHPQVYINAKRREDDEYDREDWTGTATKLNALVRLISEEAQSDHKYLVFCQFHDEMDLIAKHLVDNGIVEDGEIQQYHGGMSHKARNQALEEAKSDGCRVLLIQLHSGGVGLNLQEFDRCVFMSPWWTSALMDQAIARAVRMGQRRVVRVIHLKLAEERTMNIDRLISDKARFKKAALETIFRMAEWRHAAPTPPA